MKINGKEVPKVTRGANLRDAPLDCDAGCGTRIRRHEPVVWVGDDTVYHPHCYGLCAGALINSIKANAAELAKDYGIPVNVAGGWPNFSPMVVGVGEDAPMADAAERDAVAAGGAS